MQIFDFLSCGFSSVLEGLCTALALSGGTLLISFRSSRRGTVEPISLILCCILFFILFYQTTLLYTAIGSKSIAMDFISALHLQFGQEINGAELQERMITLIRENPLISFFVSYGDLENFDWSHPITSLRDVVAREYNWFIFRRIMWSLIFTSITFIAVYFFNGKGKRNKRRSRTPRSSRYSSADNNDYY